MVSRKIYFFLWLLWGFVCLVDPGAVRTGHCGASSAADWDVLWWSELSEGAGQSEEGAHLRFVWQHWGSQGERNSNARATPKKIKIWLYDTSLFSKHHLTKCYYTFGSFIWMFCILSGACLRLGWTHFCSSWLLFSHHWDVLYVAMVTANV